MTGSLKKILIAEDKEKMVAVWTELFSAMGYEVVSAATVEEAQRAYDEQGPWELLILDGEDLNNELFGSLLQSPFRPRLGVISASAKEEIRREHVALGCIDSGDKLNVTRVALELLQAELV